MVELEWKESINIPDGNHTGEIVKIEYRHDPYEYTDVMILVTDIESEITLKYGCPTNLSENSKLGALLQTFGEEYGKGKKVDPEKVLVGKKVVFMTITKTKGDKHFSEVVDDSIKPIVEKG